MARIRTIPVQIDAGFYARALEWARAEVEALNGDEPNTYRFRSVGVHGKELEAEEIVGRLLTALTLAWIDAGQPSEPIPLAREESWEQRELRRLRDARRALAETGRRMFDGDHDEIGATLDRADGLIERAERDLRAASK